MYFSDILVEVVYAIYKGAYRVEGMHGYDKSVIDGSCKPRINDIKR
jgi:hypothetical protein